MLLGRDRRGFLSGTEAVRQAVQTRLKHLQGEWWESPNEGLPLFQQMLGRQQTQTQREMMELLLTERIADTVGVTQVLDAHSAYDGRAFVFSARIQTEYGRMELEVTY